MQVVFRQIRRLQPVDPDPGPRQQARIVQRGRRQQPLQPRWRAAVEMHAHRIEDQPQRRVPQPPRTNRAQERILDAHQRNRTPCRDRLATSGIGRAAPDHHPVAGPRQTEAQLMPRKMQDAPQPGLPQKARRVEKQPPGNAPGGVIVVTGGGHRRLSRRWC